MTQSTDSYYLPEPSHWPLVGSVGLFLLLGGFANYLHGSSMVTMLIGFAIVLVMLFGWFGTVIAESENGQYNKQVDISFRWGMSWFIFSEVMFFAAFFGALYYVRMISIPWLDGAGNNVHTATLLWPDFEAAWPLINMPNAEGFDVPNQPMGAWGLPAINTLILLTSGATVTWAHHALKDDNRKQLIMGLFATVALGFLFVGLQAVEYYEAYHHMNLTLESGVYGSTFFMLTGFHGLHVCIGAIMLTVMMFRSMSGHFTPTKHFAFEAAAWYWHFVDVVWLGLFIFVYIL